MKVCIYVTLFKIDHLISYLRKTDIVIVGNADHIHCLKLTFKAPYYLIVFNLHIVLNKQKLKVEEIISEE